MSSHFENARNVNIEGITNISANNYNLNHYSERSSKTSIEKLREHIAAGALHNSAERYDAPKCLPETRVAVQDKVVSWISDKDSDDVPKEIMWVTGPAGSGKTAVMGSVADTCQGKGILGATHFFSSFSVSANRRSKHCLVPTLAYQFVQHNAMTQVAAQILSAVEDNPAIFEQNLEVQLDQLILEPLRACQDRPPLPKWPKVILIDGLDECGADQYQDATQSNPPSRSREGDQIEILSILKKAASDPDFPFRIVIASRPEHVIKRFFADVAKSLTRELFLDAKYNADADMALFLKSKFANIRRESQLPSSWPSEDGRFMEVSGGDPDKLLKQVLQLPGFKASTDVQSLFLYALFLPNPSFHSLLRQPPPTCLLKFRLTARGQEPPPDHDHHLLSLKINYSKYATQLNVKTDSIITSVSGLTAAGQSKGCFCARFSFTSPSSSHLPLQSRT
ncbi:hypothetical protein EST38_g9707 [Candolleomyces aberdarensis]|uniref:Nephrocystin 3-like N-terminal domain-containing protein n=1 Tax=Candolleomyces aberdarensis TaxID=2316362 RepID=A0A4Q2D994_9AGAR|nr:hypothetical protein EST38_g9707 [Candolleomyces aberdarensis]